MPILVTSNFDDDSIKNEQASMETAFSHDVHGNNPICPKTLCSLFPNPVMLHIKFDQDWPTGFRNIQVWKCGALRCNADPAVKLLRSSSTQGHHFNKLCPAPVSECCIPSANVTGQLVCRRIISMEFYHIWAWWPAWSYDQDHLNNFCSFNP